MSDERPHHNLNRDNHIEKDDPRTCYNPGDVHSQTNVDRMNYTVFQPQFPHSLIHRRRPEVAGGGSSSTLSFMASRRSLFRPCIDLHDGHVKQIVGGTLSETDPGSLKTNFVAKYAMGPSLSRNNAKLA